MNKIFVTAPAGSGMTFCTKLLNMTITECGGSKGHERFGIEEKVNQIAILRNPYDAIASGAERFLNTSNHKTFIEDGTELIDINNVDQLILNIRGEEDRYKKFFQNFNDMDHVLLVSFEFLTQEPIEFIKKVSARFNVIYNDNLKNIKSENIFAAMADEERSNRIPREKNNSRKIIEDLVYEMYNKETWETWKIYSELKNMLNEMGM